MTVDVWAGDVDDARYGTRYGTRYRMRYSVQKSFLAFSAFSAAEKGCKLACHFHLDYRRRQLIGVETVMFLPPFASFHLAFF
jgi:hypothetical protein